MITTLKSHNEKVGFTCDIPCPVYYINMDKDVDRREFMERQIEKMPNVHFTRITGFNGYAIVNKQNDIIKHDHTFIEFVNKYDDMSKSEIGCTMSHLIAIKKAYKNGDEIAMICEDDILFDTCTLIKPISEMIEEAPKNWEILQLCSFVPKDMHIQSKDHPHVDYVRNNGKNRHYNTACYLINRNGMETILKMTSSIQTDNFFIINKNLNFPSSGTADTFIYEICVTYTILPVPFTVDNTDNDSTIHTDHTDFHISSSLHTLGKFDEIKNITFPKVIYMCDKTLEFIEKYSQNWKKLNPDYEIALFDNKLCEEFLEKEFSYLHKEIFKYIPDGPIKADFWRLCVLYKNGGVYIDADNEPLLPLRDFIESNVDFVTCSSYWDKMNFNFNPNFIIAKAGEKILKDSIDLYIHWYKTKKRYNYWDWSIMKVFTEVIKIKNFNKKDGIYNINNKKIQIIREVEGVNHHDDHNIYKGLRVFNNRYKNYSADTHSFKEEKEEITFIIPTIGRQTLPKTVESLQNLHSTDWKAIIVFDGIKPTFHTNDERIKVISIDKKGEKNHAGRVRNAGIKLAETNWIGFVDDDDILLPTYIDDFKESLLHKPDVIIFKMLNNDGRILPPVDATDFYINKVGISFCLKKSCMEKDNIWFKPSSTEDFDLLNKLRSSGKKIILSDKMNYIVRPEDHVIVKHDKKILNLIVYNETSDYEVKMKNILENYLDRFSFVTFFFISYREKQIENIEMENNCIYIKGKENFVPQILDKTVLAIDYCINTLQIDFDYLLRSNISTLINFDFFPEIPNMNVYTGPVIPTLKWTDERSGITKDKLKQIYGTTYVMGICIILSKDLVNFLLQNKHKLDRSIVDDVSLGLFFKHIKILHHKFSYIENDINMYSFCTRNKTIDNREKDVYRMKKISEI
jgi:GR25 family glycosyltransferase involved in LPS biosynthesis